MQLFWRTFFGLMLVWPLTAAGLDLDVQLDRNPITLQESVTLTVTANAQVQNQQPDFGALRQDFEVSGTSQSSQIQIINGQTSATTQWQVQLFPKREGELVIPPIPIGSATSQALVLTVLPAPKAQAGTPEPLFFQAEVEPKKGVAQGQLTLRLRLFTRINLTNYQWPEVSVPGATVQLLGQEKRFQTLREGQRYMVLEQTYALFPEQGGELTIPAQPLAVEVPTEQRARRPRSLFDEVFPSRGQVRRLRSQPITLPIESIPTDFPGDWWLPAESVTLAETWSAEPPFRVGEPVTRTLTLRANGVMATQLPELKLPEIPGLKFYRDKPQTDTQLNGQQLVAERQEKIAIKPDQPGSFTLPEIRVPWWNTRTGQVAYAVLPARTIQVQPGVTTSQPAARETLPPLAPHESRPAPRVSASATSADPLWFYVSIGLLILWLVTLAAWIFTAWRQPTPPKTDAIAPSPHLHQALRALERACRDQDPKAAAAAVMDWARARHAPAANLGAVAARLENEAAAQALRALDQHLYASTPPAWDGMACWQALRPALKTTATKPTQPNPPLPRLYPQTLTH